MQNELTDLEKQHLVAIFRLNNLYAPGLDKLALRIVESISEEKQRNFSFLILVAYLAAQGNSVLAEDVARTRLGGYHQATALASIGFELASAKSSGAQAYLKDAESFLDKVFGQDDRATLLHRVSQGYSQLGTWEKAIELANQIAEPEQRASTLCEIAENLWKAGEVERLDRALSDIRASAAETDQRERTNVLNDLGEVLARIGRVSEALRAWEEAVSFADYALESPKLLFSICRNLINVGHKQQAREVALLIKNDARRKEALSLVAEP